MPEAKVVDYRVVRDLRLEDGQHGGLVVVWDDGSELFGTMDEARRELERRTSRGDP